ncbi:N-alpha-acetyltransferase 20 A isoform X2 [Calliopsis andreniformis]|uniref:N-alpha-acetyltransferase 20 A isoform X2 n=1 Tax=Calliopsis andreniformis TaxID=337506 RepID=UPI003FCE2CD2
MTTLRPFTCNDLFKFNNVMLCNLFKYVEFGKTSVMGKAEGHGENWHGHITALTVSPNYRRLGLAAMLIKFLEEVSEKKQAYFVDLFVRVSNKVAIKMYQQLGYIVYRTVLEYYNGDPDEDAFDMRKALSRDVKKKSVIPLTHPVRTEEVD